MQRSILNFWLDFLLLVVFLVLLSISCILRFVFPPGPSAADWQLWGAGFQAWSEAQFAVLCGMTLLVLLHVMLHWNWVCGLLSTKILPRRSDPGGPSAPKRKLDEGTQTLYGVALLMIILHGLAAIVLSALMTVKPPG